MTQDQIQADIVGKTLKFFEKERFGYIDGSVRLGKMKITIDFLRQYPKALGEILLCYPDNRLKEGWENEFIKWGYKNPYITLCNFSSLKNYTDFMFDLIIIDEFHNCSPAEKDYCHQIMTNAPKTICLGLSGTISKETKEEWGLKEIAIYTTEQGINDGILSDYSITVHLVNLDTKIKTANKAGKLLTEKQKYDNLSYVIARKRQQGESTMFLALARNRLSLSSIGKVAYTKKLLNTLKDKRTIVFTGLSDVADNLGIPSYHSKSVSNASFLAFQAEKSNQLALAQMAKMGVSFFNLDSVVLLNFTYNEEDTKQQLMRTLKLDYKGKMADLHVICLNEPPEIKKIKESLSMLDVKKIKYV